MIYPPKGTILAPLQTGKGWEDDIPRALLDVGMNLVPIAYRAYKPIFFGGVVLLYISNIPAPAIIGE